MESTYSSQEFLSKIKDLNDVLLDGTNEFCNGDIIDEELLMLVKITIFSIICYLYYKTPAYNHYKQLEMLFNLVEDKHKNSIRVISPTLSKFSKLFSQLKGSTEESNMSRPSIKSFESNPKFKPYDKVKYNNFLFRVLEVIYTDNKTWEYVLTPFPAKGVNPKNYTVMENNIQPSN